ncbi:MAG: CoA-transferase [Desulfobacteraceae bacterium]
MADDKLMTMAEAVDRFVPDRAAVAMCTCYEALIPFAAGHEIMRQKKRKLTLVGPISDILFDQMIGAGTCAKIQAAWVGNVITGSGYNFRRACEGKTLKVEDHSNFTISLALTAGAMGVPFMPSRTALGSDLFKTNDMLKTFSCPVTGQTLTAVKAICPDVAIIHLQRADRYGNCHIWGNTGITKEACLASSRIIVTAEEIVHKKVITSDPSRVLFPGFKVSAVVHLPFGGWPSPVPGYYNRDHDAFLEYRKESMTRDSFLQWLEKYIYTTENFDEFLSLTGKDRLKGLKPGTNIYSERVNYGY